jgi:hypothetical protein
MYFVYIVQTMGVFNFFSPKLVWSILDTIYEHTQIDKISYILLYDHIREVGVVTPRSRKYLSYIYIYMIRGAQAPWCTS